MACISLDRVVSAQMSSGCSDSVMFENFIYRTLNKLRLDDATRHKTIVLLLDNAAIHKTDAVLQTAHKMGAVVLFNAQYSPWLNPIEQLFNHLKKRARVDAQGLAR
jgi:transposase